MACKPLLELHEASSSAHAQSNQYTFASSFQIVLAHNLRPLHQSMVCYEIGQIQVFTGESLHRPIPAGSVLGGRRRLWGSDLSYLVQVSEWAAQRSSRRERSAPAQTTSCRLHQKRNGGILSQSGMQASAGARDPVRLMGMLAVEHGHDDHTGPQSTWKGWDGSKAASPDQVRCGIRHVTHARHIFSLS